MLGGSCARIGEERIYGDVPVMIAKRGGRRLNGLVLIGVDVVSCMA